GFGNRFAVKFQDDVSLLDAGLRRWASRHHLRNECAFFVSEAEGFRQIGSQILDADAEPPAGYMSLFLELRSDIFGHADGNGKTNSLALSKDRGVDPYDLALCVDQRAAAVARIDRGIGLNEIVIGTGANDPALGADDTGGHGLFQAEWTTDGDDPAADLQIVRVAHGYWLQVRRSINLHQSQIGFRVSANDFA